MQGRRLIWVALRVLRIRHRSHKQQVACTHLQEQADRFQYQASCFDIYKIHRIIFGSNDYKLRFFKFGKNNIDVT